MNQLQLEAFLHHQIPLTRHMQVQVKAITAEALELFAPLVPNSNHHGTAFGGSIASLALLCGWGWLHLATLTEGIQCELVVHKTEMNYVKAINSDFTAICKKPPTEDWKRFLLTLKKRQRARICLPVNLYQKGALSAGLIATYAAKVETDPSIQRA